MIVLVLNCGSSSIKYKVFNMTDEAEVIASGIVERIGLIDGILTHKAAGKDKYQVVADIPDHTIGINLVVSALLDHKHGVIKDINEIKAVGHRVAHGGENFKQSAFIDFEVKRSIEAVCELAPLHNPANLKGILSAEKLIPGVPQVAVFDTSFHQTMPKYAFMYAIPYEYYEKYRIRKYGFHGTSHKFVAMKASAILGKEMETLKIITCHLGNGASVAAIKNGISIDTSMGFTPVDGLIMGTRTGEIDPGVLLYLADKEDLSLQGINNLINKKSGVAGISKVSSDMRDLETAAAAGNDLAQLALEMYSYKIRKFIGAYVAAMNGLDLLIFTGGVGENDFNVRKMICTNMESMGMDFDAEVNHGQKGKDLVISKAGSRATIMTVTTDEEFVIATDTKSIIEAFGVNEN